MSESGYQQTSQEGPRYVRLFPNRRHSLADVGFRADYVCFTPNRRHSGQGWECLKLTQAV